FYNKALTSQDIQFLYSYGAQGTDPGMGLAHYKCDEGAGNTAFDSSGNGNHGTMYNITESTFHATDNTIGSWQNEVGYRQAMLITPTNKAWVEVQDDPSLTFTQSFRLKARFIFHSLGNYAIITKRSGYQTENAYSLLMKSDYK
ncbi:MAG: hypothetical protein CUN57_02160, partial [Phototrophicales bacterium]